MAIPLVDKCLTVITFLLVQILRSSASQINATPSNDMNSNSTSAAPSNIPPLEVSATNPPLALLKKIFIPVYMSCTSFSLLACMAGFAVYVIIRKVQEVWTQVRHWINWNLMASFILRDTMLLVTMALSFIPEYVMLITSDTWRVIYIFTMIPNFFWMFAEGLYLFMGLYCPFWTEQFRWTKMTLFGIGWGIPVVLVSIWSTQEKVRNGAFNHLDIPGLVCIVAPIYLVLLVNLVMMIMVIHTVAYKKNTNPNPKNLETVRKLAKCTLLLAILLGVPFIIPVVIVNTVKDGNIILIVQFVNSIWSAFQGFFVAIFYVLMNSEVMMHTKRRLSSLTPPPTYV